MFKGWAFTTLLFMSSVGSWNLQAQTLTTEEIHRNMVIQVKKNLPLHRGEPVRKDYILNAGQGQGMEPGMIYPIYRRAPIHDPFFNRSRGDLLVHVADLLVFHVEQEISVARLHALTDPETRPLLEEPAVMVGDVVDVAGGRRPAAAQSGAAPLRPAGRASRSAVEGLSPEKALEVLEAYQKAQAPEAHALPEPTGSLFEDEDPNLEGPVQVPQVL